MIFADWVVRWNIPPGAVAELQTRVLGLDGSQPSAAAGTSEAAVQNLVRVEASRKGGRLWRNNVGAGYSEDGSFMRWGLANDSAQVNKVVKSADLIGLIPVTITKAHVGQVFGRFLSREVKAAGWRYSATPREVAQLNWATLVNTLGGDAGFATAEGTIA